MPRTFLPPTPLNDAGINPATALVAANALGHSVNPETVLHVKNASASSINVTIQTGSTKGGKAVADTVVAVPAGGERLIGGLRSDTYANEAAPDQGLIYVDLSAVVTVTIAAYSV